MVTFLDYCKSGKWYDSVRSEAESLFVQFTDGFGHRQTVHLQPKGSPHCSCNLKANPCIHIQLAGSIPIAQDQDVQALVDPEEEKAAAQKDKRKAERIRKLSYASQELQLWLDDALSKGIAALVQENAAFAEGISVRMSDASLPSLARDLRILENQTTQSLITEQSLPSNWSDLIILAQAMKKWEQLPESLSTDLLLATGINMRKEDLKASAQVIQDQFTVVGVLENELEPRLYQRNTWIFAAELQEYLVIIDFKFEGATDFPPKLKPGHTFRTQAYLYPTAIHQRVHFDEVPELSEPQNKELKHFACLKDAAYSFAERVKKVAWTKSMPCLIKAVYPIYQQKTAKWYICDTYGKATPCQSEEAAQKLLAIAAQGPVDVFGIWSANGLLPVSAKTGTGWVALG